MPRPREYAGRIDTKVRLRKDQKARIDEEMEARGVSQNRLIEMALDAFLGTKKPRLQRMPADPKIQRAAQEAQVRTSPRLRQATLPEGDDTPPVIPPKTDRSHVDPIPKGPRVKPRSRR